MLFLNEEKISRPTKHGLPFPTPRAVGVYEKGPYQGAERLKPL